jgi:hypothetical protein
MERRTVVASSGSANWASPGASIRTRAEGNTRQAADERQRRDPETQRRTQKATSERQREPRTAKAAVDAGERRIREGAAAAVASPDERRRLWRRCAHSARMVPGDDHHTRGGGAPRHAPSQPQTEPAPQRSSRAATVWRRGGMMRGRGWRRKYWRSHGEGNGRRNGRRRTGNGQRSDALNWQHRRPPLVGRRQKPGRPRPRGKEGQRRAPHGPEEKPNSGEADRAAELRGVHWLGKRRRDSGTPSKDRRGRAGGVIMI